jgi:hypothetical protein
VSTSGSTVVTGSYTGALDLSGGALPTSNDTFVGVFDMSGKLTWSTTVKVGTQGGLIAAVGKCGVALATNSPSVDLGMGPLSTGANIGVAALAL